MTEKIKLSESGKIGDDKRPIVRLGIDIDETLINNQIRCDGKSNWDIKKGVLLHLPVIYQSGRFEFHCITARDSTFEAKQILEKIQNHTGVVFKTLTCTNGQRKGEYAKKLGCSYMIDDNPAYLENCVEFGVRPILLERKKKAYQKMYPMYIVCENWADIRSVLLVLPPP